MVELTEAFPPRDLDAAAFARSNTAWDAYTKAEAFDVGSQGRTWDELGSEFVDAHGGALFFLDPGAFVAVLPAYLAALLRGDTESEVSAFVFSQLTRAPRPEKFDARNNLLAEPQRSAVAHVLEALTDSDHWSRYRTEIAAALDSWR